MSAEVGNILILRELGDSNDPSEHLAEPVNGEGAPAYHVDAHPGSHDASERDEGHLVKAQRGYDAVVVQAAQQHLPAPRWAVRVPQGVGDGGSKAAKAGTLGSGAPTETVWGPSPDACPAGALVRRDTIRTTPSPGGGV